MRIHARITTTPYDRRYQDAVGDLLFHSYQLHTHLDWYEAIDWLQRFRVPARLAWQGDRLAGVMAVSQPLNGALWLRVVALHDQAPAHAVMAALWQDLLPEIQQLPASTISVLIPRNWIKNFLRELDFGFVEDVVTMERSGTMLPQLRPDSITVRAIQPGDLQVLTALDQAAFDPPWQMTFDEIRAAQRMAAQATAAELDGQLVGYQVSTVYEDGAHLARLAVDPTFQGRGIGSRLLHDVLERFLNRRIRTMTVNTQASNIRSQDLYRRFGFRRNGYDLPVWSLDIER
jgi:ribosomal protein S18 acetylase RimI-like enzyme